MTKTWLALISSGLLLGLSQPLAIEYFGATPIDSTGLSGLLCFIGYLPFLVVVKDQSPRRAFLYAFILTVIQYSISLYWINIPLHVFGNINIFLSMALSLLLSAEIAAVLGFAAYIAQYIYKKLRWPQYVIYALCFCAAEYIRNYWPFSGFPWGSSGSSLATVPLLRQFAAAVGVYGLAFFVVYVNGALATIWTKKTWKARFAPLSTAALILFSMTFFGHMRLREFAAQSDNAKIKVALLQGNIEQGIKNHQYVYAEEISARYLKLQQQAQAAGAQLIIWPESSLPLRISQNVQQISPLNSITVPAMVGAVSFGTQVAKDGSIERYFSNSAFALEPGGVIKGRYDKRHRVPFGEYVPWPLQNIANQVVPGIGAWHPGQSYKPLTLTLNDGRSISLGITVCYEGVFPEISRALANEGAQILVNMTNDAWYGVSSATYQHLMMYSLRSIETNRYYARATNTGVSAFVDPTGAVFNSTPLYQEAMVIKEISPLSEPTLYMLFGDVVPWACEITVFFAYAAALLGPNFLRRRRSVLAWVIGSLGAILAASAALCLFLMNFPEEQEVTKASAVLLIGLVLFFKAFRSKKSL